MAVPDRAGGGRDAAVGLKGALWPEPHDTTNPNWLALYWALGVVALSAVWFGVMQVWKPDRIKNAAAHAALHEGVRRSTRTSTSRPHRPIRRSETDARPAPTRGRPWLSGAPLGAKTPLDIRNRRHKCGSTRSCRQTWSAAIPRRPWSRQPPRCVRAASAHVW